MAWISLVLMIAYVGARVEFHSLAASHMEEFAGRTPGVEKWAVFPTIDPFTWNGIAQTKSQMLKLNVHPLNGVDGEIARLNRGSASDIVNKVAKTESADVLLRFSRFPVAHVEGVRFGAIGYRVVFFDFRFYDETERTALGSEIILDQSFHVKKETFSFGQVVN